MSIPGRYLSPDTVQPFEFAPARWEWVDNLDTAQDAGVIKIEVWEIKVLRRTDEVRPPAFNAQQKAADERVVNGAGRPMTHTTAFGDAVTGRASFFKTERVGNAPFAVLKIFYADE
ncbi:hypothetical protein HK104_007576, partial [Borealophlyctis nickersoniae]